MAPSVGLGDRRSPGEYKVTQTGHARRARCPGPRGDGLQLDAVLLLEDIHHRSELLIGAAHCGAVDRESIVGRSGHAGVDLGQRKGRRCGRDGKGRPGHERHAVVDELPGLPTPSGTSRLGIVVVDGTVYVSYPGISTVAPGKTWVSEPATTSTSGVQLSNASDLLRVSAAKGAVVTKTGTGTIGTTPVTEYTVQLNLGDLSNQVSQLGISASDSAAVQQLLQNGITAEVYLTDANQVRRISMQVAVPATSTTPASQESVLIDLTNYGTPVSITAPPRRTSGDAPAVPVGGRHRVVVKRVSVIDAFLGPPGNSEITRDG